jgi:DNA polymerase-3 subunit gamma/tau
VPPGVLGEHLEKVCAAEKVKVEKGVIPLVVRASGGSVRDALSVLGQLLAGGVKMALRMTSQCNYLVIPMVLY